MTQSTGERNWGEIREKWENKKRKKWKKIGNVGKKFRGK